MQKVGISTFKGKRIILIGQNKGPSRTLSCLRQITFSEKEEKQFVLFFPASSWKVDTVLCIFVPVKETSTICSSLLKVIILQNLKLFQKNTI